MKIAAPFFRNSLNFSVRSLSSGMKLILFVYLAKSVSIDVLAVFNLAIVIVGILVTFVPLERHYFYIRKFRSESQCYNRRLACAHMSKLKINSFVLLCLLLALGSYVIQGSSYGISCLIYVLVIILSAVEIMNVDYFRYLQLGNGEGFIVTQVLRNIVPPIVFIAIIGSAGLAFPVESYLSISIVFAIIALLISKKSVLGGRYKSWLCLRGITFFRHVDMTPAFGRPFIMLLFQMMPMYLDKIVVSTAPDKHLFVNYSFYSSAAQVFLIFTQTFFVQPRLTRWFEERRHKILVLERSQLFRLASVVTVLALGVCLFLVLVNEILPPVYRIDRLHGALFVGIVFSCLSGYLSAFVYAAGLDRQSLWVDVVVFVCFAVFAIGILATSRFWLCFYFPMLIGTVGFLLRLMIVMKVVK